MATGRRGRPDGPVISADVVPLLVAPDGGVKLLLSRRQFDPDAGELALPGVLILGGETVTEACLRALDTKSGVPAGTVRCLRMAWLADSPVRDERGHTISVAYLAVINDPDAADRDANEAFDLADIPAGLPFDHDAIIAGVLGKASEWLWDENEPLARDVLGGRFTSSQATAMLGDLDPGFNLTNAPRLLSTRPFLRRVATTKSTGRGRPPATWEFTDPEA
jgi:ADP-ribose pyrophosphatase YjhB (NUDIX family)